MSSYYVLSTPASSVFGEAYGQLTALAGIR